MAKSTSPSVKETAFDCPYCGAYAAQHWINLHAKYREASNKTPFIPDEEIFQRVKESKLPEDHKEKFVAHLEKLQTGLICFERQEQGKYVYEDVHNLFLSQCFNCEKFSVWVHDRLVHPTASAAPPANQDLPHDILQDYEEAGRIVNESPRGAAALLRLAIQKLCAFLGEGGKNIDDDIASLVKKGLNPTTQKALDAVRVIGNEAVHPGTLDLKDERDTAIKLFKLVNIIAEQMISNPKHVNELYGQIPEAKRKSIEKRDGG
ncbi:MAG: DUF4145 domain-containing protein [Nitrospira sp.]|nr:DUF4145 domain-containing protein [Nitrospira sp.]